MSQGNWVFAESGGGERSGFNDAGIDTFKSRRVRSVAREVIQNSLDASSSATEPVKISVETVQILRSEAPELFALGTHMEACRSESNKKEPKEFFENASKSLDGEGIRALLFHDSNTTGLVGPLEGEGPWEALTRSSGVTQKSNGGLGSFGHGARAPFALSGLRTVLYLTEISVDGVRERRAVGRAVLMSHAFAGSQRQAVGFFGSGSEAKPLVNEEIPGWLDRLRPQGLGVGTTLIVLDARARLFREKFEYEVIRSFALAIESEALSVEILGETLDKNLLLARWRAAVEGLSGDGSEDSVVENSDLQVMETTLAPSGRFVMPTSLGECEIRVLTDDSIKRKLVTVARGGGMTITSAPWGLQRFNRMQNFSCVVWVRDRDGSSLLAKLENPTHNEFSRDWLDESDVDEGAGSIWATYVLFTQEIREKLRGLFEVEVTGSTETNLLDRLLEGAGRKGEEGLGTSRVIQIVEDSKRRGHTGESGKGAVGPGKPTKGSRKTKNPGPRRLPTLNGGYVSTDGWKASTGMANCRSKRLPTGDLKLRAEFPEPLKKKVGLIFCAIAANGELLALTDQIIEVNPGEQSSEVVIAYPPREYSIEVVVYDSDESVVI
jgi:hypothetical protein